MCSGERNPSGAACSVVNETTWPTPRTVVGVIGTGCHGHHVAGGATTAWHRGHREASIVSIMAVRAAERSAGPAGPFEASLWSLIAGTASPACTEGGLF